MNTRVEFDTSDRSIMEELQVDGRMPYAKLAPRVGLSEAATRQRVNKLVERGIIQIVAVADPTMLGLRHQAMVGIDVDTDVRRVADELAKIDAIDYLVIAAGRYDIMAEVFSSDQTEFLRILNDQMRPIDGVKNLEIITYLQLVKQTYNWGTG